MMESSPRIYVCMELAAAPNIFTLSLRRLPALHRVHDKSIPAAHFPSPASLLWFSRQNLPVWEREVKKPEQFIFKFKPAQNVKTTMEGQTIPNHLKMEVEWMKTLIIQHKHLIKALPSVSFELWRMISDCVLEAHAEVRIRKRHERGWILVQLSPLTEMTVF